MKLCHNIVIQVLHNIICGRYDDFLYFEGIQSILCTVFNS